MTMMILAPSAAVGAVVLLGAMAASAEPPAPSRAQPPNGMMQMMPMMQEMSGMMENCSRMMQASAERQKPEPSSPAPQGNPG